MLSDQFDIRNSQCLYLEIQNSQFSSFPAYALPMVDLARKLDITPAAVSYAVQGGEKMAKKQGYRLESEVISIFKVVPYFTHFTVYVLRFLSFTFYVLRLTLHGIKL